MKGEIPKIIETMYEAFDKMSGGKAVCISVEAKENSADVNMHAIMPDGKEYTMWFYKSERS